MEGDDRVKLDPRIAERLLSTEQINVLVNQLYVETPANRDECYAALREAGYDLMADDNWVSWPEWVVQEYASRHARRAVEIVMRLTDCTCGAGGSRIHRGTCAKITAGTDEATRQIELAAMELAQKTRGGTMRIVE